MNYNDVKRQEYVDSLLGMMRSLDFTYDPDNPEAGFHYNPTGALSLPVTVADRPLLLPVPDVLNNPSLLSKVVVLHPLSESSVRSSESEVLRSLIDWMRARLETRVIELLGALVELGMDQKKFSALPSTAADFLALTADVSERTMDAYKAVVKVVNTKPDCRVVTLQIRSEGPICEGYRKALAVNFPLMHEFDQGSSKDKIWGQKVSVSGKKSLGALLNHILGCGDNHGRYNVGSNSDVAPMFHVLVGGYISVTRRINEAILALGETVSDTVPDVDLSWAPAFTDLMEYRSLIPSMPFNQGITATEETADAVEQRMEQTKVVLRETEAAARKPSVQEYLQRGTSGSSRRDDGNGSGKMSVADYLYRRPEKDDDYAAPWEDDRRGSYRDRDNRGRGRSGLI
jgi:hypothetical protein